MPKTILVATDFRARADRAIDRALMLGEQLGLDVVVAHAVKDGVRPEPDEAWLAEQMREVLPPGAAEPRFVLSRGRIGPAISSTAKEQDADLIVLGVARYNSIGDYFLGTAVDHVLRNCAVPALIVKKRPRAPYRKIGVATDFSTPSRDALIKAARMFPDASLHLIHTYHVPFEGFQKAEYVREQMHESEVTVFAEFMQGVPDDIGTRVETHLVYGDLHSAVAQVVSEQSLDLMVAGSHGETGFRHATLGSQANALLESVAVDTMIISPATA